MNWKIVRAKTNCFPLFRKGDKFKVIKRNKNPALMPIEALHLKSGEVYGFEKEELE